MKRVSVDLDKTLYKKFDDLCRKKHRKKVEVVRELIEGWVEDEKMD